MSKFKLPVTHVVTVQDKESGETRVYELCGRVAAKLALRDLLAEKLSSVGAALDCATLDQAADDAFDRYNEATDLFERGLVFSDPDETGY